MAKLFFFIPVYIYLCAGVAYGTFGLQSQKYHLDKNLIKLQQDTDVVLYSEFINSISSPSLLSAEVSIYGLEGDHSIQTFQRINEQTKTSKKKNTKSTYSSKPKNTSNHEHSRNNNSIHLDSKSKKGAKVSTSKKYKTVDNDKNIESKKYTANNSNSENKKAKNVSTNKNSKKISKSGRKKATGEKKESTKDTMKAGPQAVDDVAKSKRLTSYFLRFTKQ